VYLSHIFFLGQYPPKESCEYIPSEETTILLFFSIGLKTNEIETWHSFLFTLKNCKAQKNYHAMYNYYYIIISNLCALNAQFQHFIPRFDKTSLLCRPLTQRGARGVKRGPKTG
jgi:hypothetical protein